MLSFVIADSSLSCLLGLSNSRRRHAVAAPEAQHELLPCFAQSGSDFLSHKDRARSSYLAESHSGSSQTARESTML